MTTTAAGWAATGLERDSGEGLSSVDHSSVTADRAQRIAIQRRHARVVLGSVSIAALALSFVIAVLTTAKAQAQSATGGTGGTGFSTSNVDVTGGSGGAAGTAGQNGFGFGGLGGSAGTSGSPNGGTGGPGEASFGGAGAGGGGGGANGPFPDPGTPFTSIGGDGGVGGAGVNGGIVSSGGGGGGAGGDASRFGSFGGVTFILTQRFGGNGGNGGAATLASGGGGGGGGAGVVFLDPGTLEIFHNVTGGAGGAGGIGGSIGTGGTGGTGTGGAVGGNGGAGVGGGGGGGAGIVLEQGGSLIIDNGMFIRGGAGGAGAQGGAGGAGIVGGAGGNTSVSVKGGFVIGGLGGDGVTRANAISLFGDNNRVEVQAHPIFGASLFTGNVAVSGGGTNNVLALGGAVDADFDVSQIGATKQYRGFDTFEKTGSGTWTLFGAGNQNWSVTSGVLRGDTSSLAGHVTFASGAGSRSVTFDQNFAGTYGGTISGDGTFTKVGTGTVTLTGTHSYTGGTTIQAGILQIGDATHVASIPGAVTVNAAGGLDLVNADTAGITTIANDGVTRFLGNASAGHTAISNGTNGKVDFSGSTGPAGDGKLAVGSIAGAGHFFLGNREFAVGGSGTSTTVSGLISDGNSAGGGASGGSLVKIGAGTLTLTGANTYTGGTTIAAGALSVAADANLGGASGALTFTGGTLVTTGSFDTARTVSLPQAGRFDVAAATTLGLTGAMTGSGDLIKLGAGTLRLDNAANAYGNTLVQAGTLIGHAGSISGHIGNAGTVVFQQAADASFAGDIQALNGLRGSMVKQGAGVLTLGGISALDWTITAGGLVTAADRFGGNAAIGAGASLTFDQTANASYAGALSGQGSFHKGGSGALNLTGNSSAFTGTTIVDAGLLSINGSLANSAVTVASGASLGGNGTVGDTVVSGTVTPGNSIGTLHVAGNVTFNAGSTYKVELNVAGQSDRVDATGSAAINGGTVQIANVAGSYGLGARYTIVTASGGVSGTFASLTAPSTRWAPFLAFGLSYDPNAVYLDVTRNAVSFASVGQTRNQIATAGGLDSLPLSSALVNAVAQLDTPSARNAFDGLSGELHASVGTALVEGSGFVRDSATNRIRAAFGAIGASRAPVMALADPAMAYASIEPKAAANTAVPATTERFALWGQGFGGWGHTGGDGNAARLNRSTGGFVAGGDAPILETSRLGMMAGYSRTSFDVRDRASSGASDNCHLGLYGGTQWGNVGLRAGAAYTWHDISTGRSVALPGFSDSLKAGYRAGTAQLFGELGYGIRAGRSGVEPFVNLAYVNLRTDGFAETGGAAALSGNGSSTAVTFSTLGLRASTDLRLGGMNLTARATPGWRHGFGDTVPLSTLIFAGGSSFTVSGVPIARDALVLDAGLDVAMGRNATFGISYGGQFGHHATDQSLKGSLAVSF
ncbi:autotransporter domain-containing protein [Bradyrhizobium sp. A5]|uniref:autotransporter outer membrane beta-barrel domain-containing protein n=1 Tax=Bradyrhizobium sp. A5 TaxID=3133696 RepID=UPI00324340DF